MRSLAAWSNFGRTPMSKGFFAATPHLIGEGDIGRLEARLATHYGMRHAVCVSSATTGLMAVALALNLRGSWFVTTPLTYGASLSGWLMLGNRPAFVDVGDDHVTLDPSAISTALATRPRAILAVDLLGYPCDVKALREVASAHGMLLVVDATQSLGAVRDGLASGHGADAVVVSFTSGKSLDAGEGGAVLTNDSDIYRRLLWWTQHPLRQKRDLSLDIWNEFGLNGRMHPAAAQLAVRKWDAALDRVATHRSRVERDLDALASCDLIEPRAIGVDVQPSYFRALVMPIARAHKGLPAEARARRLRMSFTPLPCGLVPESPAFRALYHRRGRVFNYPRAKRTVATALCLA